MTDMARWRLVAAIVAGVLLVAARSSAGPQGSLEEQAYDAVYNLDYDQAAELFARAIASDPNAAGAYRGAAKNAWLRILFLRGAVTSDQYLGKMSSSDLKVAPPPAGPAAEFHRHISKAVDLGEKAVARQPNSPSAHYDLGAALGYIASYTGTIEGKVFGAMRAARRAYAEHEKVLALDPKRHDAGLVVGTYRYIVAALPMPVRWMAYMVGFGGNRETAIRRLREAATYRSDAQADARFALVLIYNREGRYEEALEMVRGLQRSFPRNRLLWLEEGGTALRARRPEEAERAIDAGLARMLEDARPRMPGEAAQLHYKRAVARLLLRNVSGSERDLQEALADASGPAWVRGRIHTEMGKLADLRGDRMSARGEYRAAVRLGEQSNDPLGVDEAKRLLGTPYR